jgi:4'-phosphopantetheinyl transferase EntD
MPENSIDRTLIDPLYPGEVITEEAHPMCLQGTQYSEEEAYLRNAMPKRRLEFTAGRLCVRKALMQLGIENFPLLVGNNREPIWPAGIVGSISHTEGYCAVAVARKCPIETLGLDVELIRRLSRDCLRQICTQSELVWVDSLLSDKRQENVALLFSAKECLYKCQYPISRTWLDFQDVAITINPDKGEFNATLLINAGGFFERGVPFRGKYLFRRGYVLTGMLMTTTRN